MADAPINPSASAQPARAEAKSGKRGKVAIAVVALGVGLSVWWGWLRPREEQRSATAGAAPTGASRTVLPLESFTVNLADQEDGRFLRATLALGVDGQLPLIAKGEIKPVETGAVSMATIRDAILTVLAQCTSEQLLTPEGKAKLKTDLLDSLNRQVPELRVRQVYFTEFLVQR